MPFWGFVSALRTKSEKVYLAGLGGRCACLCVLVGEGRKGRRTSDGTRKTAVVMQLLRRYITD